MAKQEQVLQIDPQHELTFIGPFTTAVSAVMNLKNPADQKVCFKIKTTAPKRYCVKPNSGVIDPKKTVQVAVSLQPFEYDPQEKNRHKFMVQAMFAPEGDINPDTLWKETDGSQLMDSKLKCVFVMPENNNSSAPAAGGVTANGEKNSSEKCEKWVDSNKVPSKEVSYSPETTGDSTDKPSDTLKRSVDEIKRLQEEISALRQENLQLKEEALRQKRLASNKERNEPSRPSQASEGFTVQPMSPDATALSTTYIYAALFVLVIGIIIGKWIF